MKWILTICAAFTTLVGTETKVFDQYGYLDLGLGPAPFPIPIFGGGYRMQSEEHGFDTHVRVTTLVEVTSVQTGIHYFRYFNPNLEKQFYFGVGPSVGVITGRWWGTNLLLSPEFVFGKSYLSDTGARRFLEVNIDFPMFGLDDHRWHYDPLWFPLVSLHYGWGF